MGGRRGGNGMRGRHALNCDRGNRAARDCTAAVYPGSAPTGPEPRRAGARNSPRRCGGGNFPGHETRRGKGLPTGIAIADNQPHRWKALGYREIPVRTRPQNLETRRRNRAATRGGFDRNARNNGLTLVGYFAWHISRGIFRACNLQDLIYSFLVTAP